jgi:diguanylate cyclase
MGAEPSAWGRAATAALLLPPPELPAFLRCSAATTLAQACDGLADDLLDAGFELPSIYLLNGQRLRCHAARGYFQVVDGFRPGSAVIGRVVQSGEPSFLADVAAHPEFVAAIPGLRAEACAPVRCSGAVVGAINVESRTALGPQTPSVLAAAADLLGRRLEDFGGLPQPSTAQRLAQIAVELTGAATVEELEQRAAEAAMEISGMSSAAVVRMDADPSVTRVTGPLSERLRGWAPADLSVMASWVSHGTSSHFPGSEEVPAGYAFLRRAGVRSVSVHPLVERGQIRGLLVVADEQPVTHPPTVVECLELLAAQTAAALGMAGLLRDVSRRAERDDLTGLRNRLGFTALLTAELSRRRPGDPPLAVLLLDLDDFKHVNDSLGHRAGDRLLAHVAAQIRAVLRAEDTACRLGGDEFVVVLPRADEQAAVRVADRVLQALSALTVAGADLGTSASIGIALTARAGDTAESLLSAADLAMYVAKQQGKGRCAVFEQQMQTAAVRRMGLTRDLRRALRGERLSLAFQPIVELATGRVTAVEALARWNDNVRGPVSPAEFVRLAEENGDIDLLGAWVLRTAARQLREWDAAGAPALSMCVNVSPRQLERGSLLPLVDACLAEGLAASRLVLEITETGLMEDSAVAQQTLRDLRRRGVNLAVDDFGTGWSSLGRLRSAPVGRVKIDRSFVAEISDPGVDVPIVDAILALASGLGLGVVAEGVETPEQLDYLRRRGCAEAQGYLLARPLPADELLPALTGEAPWRGLFTPT